MASAGYLLRCHLLRSTAVVCVITVLLFAALQRTRGPVQVLHAGASQNLALLKETRAGLTRGNPFMISRSQGRVNPFLQSTVNFILPSTENHLKGALVSKSSVAETAFDNGGTSTKKHFAQAGEDPLQNGERPKRSSVAVTLLQSLDKVRRTHPQLTIQEATGSQKTPEWPLPGAESGAPWAALRELEPRTTGTFSVARSAPQGGSESPFVVSTKPNGRKFSPFTGSPHVTTLAVGVPSKEQADSASLEVLTSLLLSLQAISSGQVDPVERKDTRGSRVPPEAGYAHNAGVAAAAQPGGVGPAQRRGSLPPQTQTSTVTIFPTKVDGGQTRAVRQGAQVATEDSVGIESLTATPQNIAQSAEYGAVTPPMPTWLYSVLGFPVPTPLAGRPEGSVTPHGEGHLQHPVFNPQPVDQPQHRLRDQKYVMQDNTKPSPRPRTPITEAPTLEDLRRMWYSHIVEQARPPHTGTTVAEGTGEQQTRRVLTGGLSVQTPRWNSHPQTTSTGHAETDMNLSATEFQSQLQRMGYRDARELPRTKGIKTMATGIALGMAGALPASAVAGILGIGVLKYVLSKRAQARAAAATPGSCL